MPRTARILLEHACYHIINRGNQKQTVFFESSDYKKYLEIVRHYKKKYKFKLYAYCLMPNHTHLILEAQKVKELSKIMQSITQTYTIWFNNKYKKVGHLWQGRFKSMVIQKDKYLLDCLKYIELNPVRAEINSNPSDYPWSSWNERMFGISVVNGCLSDIPQQL